MTFVLAASLCSSIRVCGCVYFETDLASKACLRDSFGGKLPASRGQAGADSMRAAVVSQTLLSGTAVK